MRTRRLLAAGLLVAGLTAVPATAGQAAPAAPSGTVPYTVTLLTGDVVTVSPDIPGCGGVRVQPAARSGAIVRRCDPDGHVHVIPSSVAGQIGTLYDEDLFDVTTLIANGYDDARSPDLPVIMRPSGNARIAGKALPSIGAVAVRLPKKQDAAARRSSSGAAEKIWLDHRVRATPLRGSGRLDTNLAQISAPQAWKAGFTGRGVRVAVLDTGADFTHPDLAGRVAERADFIDEGGDATDLNGHGTHVATTVAGSGAASGGARRGVAPDATLLVGKVLDEHGGGSDSQVIAGMEWAAARADVVSMSLGDSLSGEDGPLTRSLNQLSASTGALFVVAAGNDGPGPGTVASPGNAASALTVGAVDAKDRIADFSSRGPLTVARSAKPEVTAPGVDIVAGRAEGTTLGAPIDARYVSLSGTSMATPHVAGEIALIKQRHPGWTAAELKAAAIGATDPVPGSNVYTAGAGRVDAARALGSVVSRTPVVALGATGTSASLQWAATEATTLRLDVAERGAALSTTTIKIGRNGTGNATLRIDRSALRGRTGFFEAVVTARTPKGDLVSRTPVTFEIPGPRHTLTVATKPVPDAYEGGTTLVTASVINEDDPAVAARGTSGDPGDTLSFADLPAGRYALQTSYFSNPPDYESSRVTVVNDEITVRGDLRINADPARAEPLSATVDGVSTRIDEASVSMYRTAATGLSWVQQFSVFGADPVRLSVAPIPKPQAGTMRVYTAYSLVSPTQRPTPYHYDLLRAHPNGLRAGENYRVTRAEHAKLGRIEQHSNVMTFPYEVIPAMRRYGYTPQGEWLSHSYSDQLPAVRTDYVSPGFLWQDEGQFSQMGQEGPRAYAPGSRTEKQWGRQPVHSDWYDNPDGAEWVCAAPPSRTSGNLHFDLTTQTELHDRTDCLVAGSVLFTRQMSLYRNGELVGSKAASRADFSVPREFADYRLQFDVDMSRIQTISTKTSTSWTFRSAGPAGPGTARLPLLAVDYDLALDRLNHATGRAATFTVRQSRELRPQRVTAFTVRTSVDDGKSWRPVTVKRSGGTFQAVLPKPPAGGFLSLRVTAQADGGSGIDQTIMHAYAG
ncbi:S8 family serine peptidase [Actinoplanes sp. TRM 88003]|uniref:S8 family serine peptidase n=1 Tax=Paractinoplanes aksuensis TaxID=2939490 RepID=A0ABT1DN35_9ACTN|nr:S8 family serine peptidase [Actinoplanes aksuensis]MCO8272257.1 S8 family serine peptidase [Actinoplanes aksuensis]